MATRQETRPVTTVSGLQDGSDGARLLNFYATAAINPRSSKVPILLQSAPGFSEGVTVAGADKPKNILTANSPIWGDHVFVLTDSMVYVYSDLDAGTIYYEFATPLDLNISDDQPLRWTTDGRYVMMVTDREVYAFDRKIIKANVDDVDATNVWRDIVAPVGDDDSDDTTTENWVDIVWIDGYFILGNQGGQIFHSNLRSLQFDELDFARADSKPDGIVALAAHKRLLYVFGSETIEMWYNAGLADFAFARDNSFTKQLGIYVRESLAQDERAVYFLGSDLSFYQMAGGTMSRMSNEIVDRLTTDVVRGSYPNHKFPAFTYTEYAHKFYCINLDMNEPDSSYWVYDLETGAWHERSGDPLRNAWILDSTRFKGKNYVLTAGNSNVRELSVKHYRGLVEETIEREVVLPVIDADHNRVRHHNISFDPTYKGGDDDVISMLLEWSDDNKRTWKGEGRGFRDWDPDNRMRWNTLGVVQFSGRNYRLTIHGGNGELALQGAYSTIEVVAD